MRGDDYGSKSKNWIRRTVVQIEFWPIGRIKEYDGNPRQISDAAVAAVARSIREFGFKVPVLVDKDGTLIAGHTRVRAARLEGLTELPVILADDLTPEQVRAFRIADNKLHELATWDNELLSIELSELQSAEFALDVIGFDGDELAKLLGSDAVEGLCDPDDVPEPPEEAITKPGDLWILGDHRLLCGDSTSADDIARLLGGEKAALCATDPPYLVDYTGERPNDSGKDWTANYREIDIKDADGFFRSLFTNIVANLAPNAAIYCWHAHKRQALIARVWDDLGILDHQQIIWVKPTPVFGRVFWHFKHEPCMMGWIKGSQPPHDGDQSVSSVWEIDWEGKSRIVGNEHPTQKPVEIFARPMRKHTNRGDVCFEPFSGSGSQLIAAEQLGRRCYAMEVSPVFVDVAVRRWETFTGKKAERQSTTVIESKRSA
jgi:DNA modification methylase